MKRAILYIRVSTDEQADKGYSLPHQEETLRNYCKKEGIEVLRVIKEDFSAKTFERPAWKGLLIDIRKKSMRPDYILFTKWDRFSRNAGDAYQMISTLRKLGTEPQGIEQPLDLSIPENKMMLAFYLAAPEVENDRRSLNIFHGLRRARKEGRWPRRAPFGYRNKTTPDGRPTIVVHEKEARELKWVFESVVEGNYSIEEISRQIRSKGSELTLKNLWWAVRNPFYCGKVFVPAYKDEPAMFVEGQHDSIITESFFNEIQEALENRGRKRKTKVVSEDEIPLRGFLTCPKCSRNLTASASKGRMQYYYYYHCSSKCGVRFKAGDVNNAFVRELSKFKPKKEFAISIKELFTGLFDKERKLRNAERYKLVDQIDQENAKLTKARKLLLSDAISPEDYREMKGECENEIIKLEAQLDGMAAPLDKQSIKFLDRILNMASNLDNLYVAANSGLKRRIIGSIFPKNWCFDGTQHRTTLVNEAFRCIYLINRLLQGEKIKTKPDFPALSSGVELAGVEPASR